MRGRGMMLRQNPASLNGGGAAAPNRRSVLGIHQQRQCSRWRSCRQGDRSDSVLQRDVRHFSDCFVRRQSIGPDDERCTVAFGRLEQRPKLLNGYFLIAKVNRRYSASRDADDLLVWLRPERESRERQ